jgi:hypothetical protein
MPALPGRGVAFRVRLARWSHDECAQGGVARCWRGASCPRKSEDLAGEKMAAILRSKVLSHSPFSHASSLSACI